MPIVLYSLVNLDKLEKRHSKNTKKDSDESTDDNDALSNIKRLNRGKGKQTIEEVEEESLMDHLKKIENDDPSIIQSDSNSDEPVRRVTNADPMPVSNEDLISEANRVAKENLLNSSSDAGKRFINGCVYVCVCDNEYDPNITLVLPLEQQMFKREKNQIIDFFTDLSSSDLFIDLSSSVSIIKRKYFLKVNVLN